jgi:Tfp pilus assembly protein PilF
MKSITISLFYALILLLSGCAAIPTATADQSLLRDALFTANRPVIDSGSVLRVSPEMKAYLEVEIADQLKNFGNAQGLYSALYSKRQLKLEYDSERTRTALEAFTERSGNCLSLAIMTAAFADELNLPSHFEVVETDENWLRFDDLYITNTHVNLTLGRKLATVRAGSDSGTFLTIDFSPLTRGLKQKSSPIDRSRILAMYMNNRAAETLVQRHPAEAYWWAREAILQDPTYASAFNTLSVIYRRAGHASLAEAPLQHALKIEPMNVHALSNLKDVLNDLNRTAERDAVARKLKSVVRYEPYHFFDLGRTAFNQQQFQRAKELFSREISRQPYNHEFHFWLARTHVELGDLGSAAHHLANAMDTSTTLQDLGLYRTKLAKLKRAAGSVD